MEKKRQIDVFRGKLNMDASPYMVVMSWLICVFVV